MVRVVVVFVTFNVFLKKERNETVNKLWMTENLLYLLLLISAGKSWLIYEEIWMEVDVFLNI